VVQSVQGKSTISEMLSKALNVQMIETDDVIVDLYEKKTGQKKNCALICDEIGENKFRELEADAVEEISQVDWKIISTGGSTMLNSELRNTLRRNSIIVFLYNSPQDLFDRYIKTKPPAYLIKKSTTELFIHSSALINEVIKPYADITVNCKDKSLDEILEKTMKGLQNEFLIKHSKPNSFGQLIQLTTFGESHGTVVGAVLDGIKPGLDISEEYIQSELNKRRPGQSKVSTPRNEKDKLKILTGVFNGKSTGMPICMIIENKDQDSSKYESIKDIFRPGTADYTFQKKYNIRDYRGSGRASGRETAARVMGGAIAKNILNEKGIEVIAHTVQVGSIIAKECDYNEIDKNIVRCADKTIAKDMEKIISEVKQSGDSVGGAVQLVIKGLPAGVGDPVFGKLNARLGAALLSIGGVKAIEFGAGFEAASMLGSEIMTLCKTVNLLKMMQVEYWVGFQPVRI
jgi:chorismate synthase